MNDVALPLLTQLPVGTLCQVQHFTDQEMASRLMIMGILPGVLIAVARTAPFHTTLYCKVNTTMAIGLRQSEAACIVVKVVG